MLLLIWHLRSGSWVPSHWLFSAHCSWIPFSPGCFCHDLALQSFLCFEETLADSELLVFIISCDTYNIKTSTYLCSTNRKRMKCLCFNASPFDKVKQRVVHGLLISNGSLLFTVCYTLLIILNSWFSKTEPRWVFSCLFIACSLCISQAGLELTILLPQPP